ncbi:VOC family protein [Alphaproteobacteria bacterium LSUCC0684]
MIACSDLAAGIAYIKHTFGVDIPAGGQHHFMGTHNAVMAVGDGIYLEVIAVDPKLPAPPGPRWFGLDTRTLQDRLDVAPVLVHYVLRTDDMAATLAGLDEELLEMLGPATLASRGDLRWKITLNTDGVPPFSGCIPALIEWQGVPPQYGMAFKGPVFGQLKCLYPDAGRLQAWLEMLGAGRLIEDKIIAIESGQPPGLMAEFFYQESKIQV